MLFRSKIILEARKHAEESAQKELDDVKMQIQQEKDEAIRSIRRQVAELSVDIAEKVLRKNLDESDEQMDMIGIEFSGMNFKYLNNTVYKFNLDGMQNEWVELGNSHQLQL